MQRYRLAKQVSLCLHGDHLVFLDLDSGRYFALQTSEACNLGGIILGWPFPQSPTPNERLAELLQRRGILTSTIELGKDAALTVHPIPTATLADVIENHIPEIRIPQVWIFLTSITAAWLSLRLVPIKRITHAFAARKRTCPPATAVADIAAIARWVAVFNRLRPFAFATKDRCILYSLALGRFLTHYGVRPEWVFAVQTEPFEAHCWLQHESFVLNDRHTRVCTMTPIHVV